jgi:hypothetical protein
MHPTFFQRIKSVAAPVLISLGILIFGGNLEQIAIHLSQVFYTTPRQAIGMLPAISMAASQVVQACAANHQGFLQACLLRTLVSAWPLLLVAVGAFFSPQASKK